MHEKVSDERERERGGLVCRIKHESKYIATSWIRINLQALKQRNGIQMDCIPMTVFHIEIGFSLCCHSQFNKVLYGK